MQSVIDAFSVEAVDSTRYITQSTQVAWKKDYRSNIRFFTIGVSRIGGVDTIAGPQGVNSQWKNYLYQDESNYVMNLGYDRELNMPLGGLVKGLANARLDNTSGRFTPRYAGGNSELFTAILPRRPLVINAGFKVGGVDYNIPQFVGVLNKTPKIDIRGKTADLSGVDFIDYLQNRFVDQSSMFTSKRSDVVIESILSQLGFSTAQYDLDTGINIINFGIFNQGDKFGDIIDKIVKAEYGHFYQDEEGRLRFENRQHWSNYPYNQVQRVIATSQVLNANVPTDDHIINVVEVKGSPRTLQANQLIWQLSGQAGAGTQTLAPSSDTVVWANLDDPAYTIDTPVANGTSGQTSFYAANSQSDSSGTDSTSSISLKRIDKFAQAAKMTFTNNTANTLYLTALDLWGKPARKTGDIYYRNSYDSSITAYEERPVLTIDNEYIQDLDWAQSYANMVLEDFSDPENLQEITIRALPELQLGDLISWQGRYWRIYGIKATLDPSTGFTQTLKLLQRRIRTYFRIGVSRIGGTDVISP